MESVRVWSTSGDFLHSWIPGHALCFFHLLQPFAYINTSVYSCVAGREKLLCHMLSGLDFIACVLIINYKSIHKTGLGAISLGNELIRQAWQLDFYQQKTDKKLGIEVNTYNFNLGCGLFLVSLTVQTSILDMFQDSDRPPTQGGKRRIWLLRLTYGLHLYTYTCIHIQTSAPAYTWTNT